MGRTMKGVPPPLSGKRSKRQPGEAKLGPPHSFGYLRRAEFDAQCRPRGALAYEAPSGKIVAFPPNADLCEVAPGQLIVC